VGAYLAPLDAGSGPLDLDAELSVWRWTRGYVEDVADAIVTAALESRASGRTYNVGENEALTEGEWVRAIARVAGHPGRVVDRARRHLAPDVARVLEERDLAHDIVLDTSRIRAELGWRPRTSLDEALAASIAWEREVARVARR
jgi:nucleoside-diphosphate-sugar epimerase